MKSFKDRTGRAWLIEVNVTAIKKVRALCDGLDLVNMIQFDGERPNTAVLDRLSSDPVLLVDLIYVLCKDQADQDKITDEEFGRRMNGDAIEAATTALLEEMIDFFPEAKRRLLRLILDQAEAMTQKMRETSDLILKSPEFQEQLQNQLMKSSMNTPESSEG